ncbi:MAG TPA: acyl carrier protein [Rhodocyclaceae bacterium]|nr:acyl carrier protein [Rhodocyclaceae bacterium]
MGTLQTVRDYVVENFLFGDGSRLEDSTSFLQNGIIDSTGILELTAFIEDTFGVRIEDHELVPDNMDSLTSVAAFVARKLAVAGRAA